MADDTPEGIGRSLRKLTRMTSGSSPPLVGVVGSSGLEGMGGGTERSPAPTARDPGIRSDVVTTGPLFGIAGLAGSEGAREGREGGAREEAGDDKTSGSSRSTGGV